MPMLPDTAIAAREAERLSRENFNRVYFYNGKYDRLNFINGYQREFGPEPKFRSSSLPEIAKLLGSFEKDILFTDVRWVAYALATVFHETKGRMEAIDEIGKGTGYRYGGPVKVFALDDGRVRVTEQDGDQVVVAKSAIFTYVALPSRGLDTAAIAKFKKDPPKKPIAFMGSRPGALSDSAYDKDLGVEKVYYGRGFVQLTWWDQYARVGAKLGYGLKLLLDPEKVNEYDIAYKILSEKLGRGVGVTGSKTLAAFIVADKCDYVGARALVNVASDAAGDVAKFAEKFERVLRDSVVTV